MSDVKYYEKKIKELEAQKNKAIDELKQKQDYLRGLTPQQRLAEYIHEKTCTRNHTDGCSWYYESWKNPSKWTRELYLRKAEYMLKFAEEETIAHILDGLSIR